MAIVTQTLIETFNSELQSRMAFILAGAYKSSKVSDGSDGNINMRVIDPTRDSAQYDSATVGSNTNAVAGKTLKEKVISLPLHHAWRCIEEAVVKEAANMTDEQLRQHIKKTAQDMAEDIVERRVARDVVAPSVALVGDWKALKKASSYLKSIGCGNLLGFVNPEIPAEVADKFIANDGLGKELYSGLGLGKGADGVEYYSERYLGSVTLTADTFTVSATISGGAISALTITGSTGTQTLPKGTPITLKGLKACDGLGNVTGKDAVIVLNADVVPASKVYTLTGKFAQPILSGAGRQVADEDGTDAVSADVTGASIPAAGTYFIGIVRADGCVAVGSVKTSVVDAETGVDNFDGIEISTTTFNDKSVVDMKTERRFDWYGASGFIDPRLSALVYVKESA